MKAVGFTKSLPISDVKALEDFDLPEPTLKPTDLLVEIKAVSVNPIDIKTRLSGAYPDGSPRILGFDAAGIVKQCAEQTKGFKPGDEVFFAGAINRAGSYAEYTAIDYRLVALKPKTLDFASASALPLTMLTAYEMLFDRLKIHKVVHEGRQTLLINGGAGGVASAAIQLARNLSDLTIIATASRPQSHEWVKKMGAHFIIDHSKPFAPQLEEISIPHPAFIFSISHSDDYLPQFAEMIAPQGRLGLIDSPKTFDINPLKGKSVSVHWESMFTRSLFETFDIARQGEILNHIAELTDNGALKTTLNKVMAPLNAATLREAHRLIEEGNTIGKIIVERA